MQILQNRKLETTDRDNIMSLTIETDLKDILNKLDQRLERIELNITDLKLGQSDINGEIKTINTKLVSLNDKFDGLQKTVDKLSTDVSASNRDISDLKGVKSLIVPGFVAILASLLTFVFRTINLP
jgi:archaellum component FlaC